MLLLIAVIVDKGQVTRNPTDNNNESQLGCDYAVVILGMGLRCCASNRYVCGIRCSLRQKRLSVFLSVRLSVRLSVLLSPPLPVCLSLWPAFQSWFVCLSMSCPSHASNVKIQSIANRHQQLMASELTGHLLANPVVPAMQQQQLQHVTPWHKYFG